MRAAALHRVDAAFGELREKVRDTGELLLKQISGAGGGGGKGVGGASNSPNTLQSDSIASLIILLSEGECTGLANGLQDVYFSFSGRPSDAVPVQNSNGSYNFNGVNAIFTPGTPDQDPLPGFPAVQNTTNVGQQILFADPYVFEVTDPNADSVIVTVELPSLYFVNSSNGSIGPNAQAIEIDVQPNGGSYAPALITEISGQTSSAYQKSYSIPLTGSAPWTVRVMSGTPDSVSVDDVRSIYVASYTVNDDYALSYPDSCLLGLQVDARLFGTQIPTVFVNLQGVQFQVPANYDPVARTYATSGPGTSGGVWDGTFKTAWTNNPAWVLYGLITNGRYGLGQYVDTALVDYFALYAIGQYCDQLVPDGAGGQEPRYVYNGVIASQDDALKALQTIASCFRGMVFWGALGVTATADMPADPVKLITPANVIDGMITYSGTGQKAIHTVALVDWRDPSLNYEKNTQVVESPNLDDIARFGWRPISLAAAGCTSRGQANRMGLWLLYTERLQSETASWTASWDNADLTPGDIVSIADPAYAGARFGGRLKAVASGRTQVTIDAPVTLEAGQSYQLLVAYPDGTIGQADITNGAGSTATLFLAAALTQAPVAGALWQINSTELEPRQFTVIALKENDRNLFEITALLHDPDIYDLVEEDILLEAPVYTLLPGGGLPAPSNLSVLPGTQSTSGVGTAQPVAILSWTAPPDPRITQFEAQVNIGGVWQPSVFTTPPSYPFANLPAASYKFRVRSVSAPAGATSLTSAWAELDGVDFSPATVPASPGSVTVTSFAQGLQDFVVGQFAAIKAAADQTAGLIASVAQEQDAQGWFDKYNSNVDQFTNNTTLQGNIDTLASATDAALAADSASIISNAVAIAGLNGAFASYQLTVSAEFATTNAAVSTNATAIADLDGAFSNYVVAVSAAFAATNAQVSTNATAIADLTGAFSSFETTVSAEFKSTNSNVTLNAEAISSLGASLASYETSVNASIGSLDASVSTNATAIATIDGKLAAQYTLTLDVNGYISGVQAYNNGANSQFIIIADDFEVAQPGRSGGDPVPIFAIANVSGTPKIAIAFDMISDASIEGVMIAAQTIEADNIVDNSLTAPQIIHGTATSGIGVIPNNIAVSTTVNAVSGRLLLDGWVSFQTTSSAIAGPATLEMLVDGVVVDSAPLYPFPVSGIDFLYGMLFVSSYIDAGAGDHTVKLQIVPPSMTSGNVGVGAPVLRVIELIK